MSDDDRSARDAPVNGDRAGETLDATDEIVLRRLGELFEGADGPPEGFTERMRFAVAARGLADELARMSQPAPVAARGQERPARTWTFEAASLTIFVAAEPTRDGGTRVDGWLAPVAPRTVRLRRAAVGSGGGVGVDVGEGSGGDRETVADQQGRFDYPDVPRGLVQIVVVASDDGPGVVTPTFEL
jgi:hypothetical protein